MDNIYIITIIFVLSRFVFEKKKHACTEIYFDHEFLESNEFNHTSLRLYALRMAARAEQVRIRVIRAIRGQTEHSPRMAARVKPLANSVDSKSV